MRPTLTEIKQSPLYSIAESNWLEASKKRQSRNKKKTQSSDVINDVYQQLRSRSFDFSMLLSLEYLQYLEKYVL